MDYILYHSHVSIAITYGVVICEETLCLIVTKFMHVYYIIMQNGRILILIVLDKNKLIFYLDTHYPVIMHWIPLQFYTDIIQWWQMQIYYFPLALLLIICISASINQYFTTINMVWAIRSPKNIFLDLSI